MRTSPDYEARISIDPQRGTIDASLTLAPLEAPAPGGGAIASPSGHFDDLGKDLPPAFARGTLIPNPKERSR